MGDRLAESLLTTTSTIASEYFTQDEMTTFKKPKKKKKLRKKDKLDLDALEAEAVAEGLGTTDMGSRDTISRRAIMQDEMKAAADARRERYESAVAKAADASRILKEESEAKAMDVDKTEEIIVGAEEEEVMQKSLDRARQAALKKQAENASGPQAIAARLAGIYVLYLTTFLNFL
jgi:U4/U6.U5 tri-snRNP-associated protein 1